MIMADRIEALKSKHAGLEEALEEENSRPRPDDSTIAQIKREKLRVKDEIAELSKA
jgi:hypothetical protein